MILDELPLELLLEMQERMVDPLKTAAERALKRDAGAGFYVRHTARTIGIEPPIPMQEASDDLDDDALRLVFSTECADQSSSSSSS